MAVLSYALTSCAHWTNSLFFRQMCCHRVNCFIYDYSSFEDLRSTEIFFLELNQNSYVDLFESKEIWNFCNRCCILLAFTFGSLWRDIFDVLFAASWNLLIKSNSNYCVLDAALRFDIDLNYEFMSTITAIFRESLFQNSLFFLKLLKV